MCIEYIAAVFAAAKMQYSKLVFNIHILAGDNFCYTAGKRSRAKRRRGAVCVCHIVVFDLCVPCLYLRVCA